ncbi:MAG TPA: transposase [Thermoanaerobaculia bacterium]|nr:transposase [Thermoanaerobaculia bacterium]
MATAVGEPDFRPGMVAVVQTHGDTLAWHPHVHAIVPRGGWDRDGRWTPLPFVDPVAAERLFRHRVLNLLRAEGLLSDERLELLLSWRHSGFSANNAVTVDPGDTVGIERLARYCPQPRCARGGCAAAPRRLRVPAMAITPMSLEPSALPPRVSLRRVRPRHQPRATRPQPASVDACASCGPSSSAGSTRSTPCCAELSKSLFPSERSAGELWPCRARSLSGPVTSQALTCT